MKKYQIINYHRLLSQIDLQKVDKESRSKLISLDILLGDIVDAHNEEMVKVKARLSKGHEAAIREVSQLITELQGAEDEKRAEIVRRIDGNTEYAIIQSQLDEEVNKRLNEEVEISVEKISSTDLAQWCADSNMSITLDMLREFRRSGLTV